jgi:short-subunit dehydrogenase
MLGTRIPPKSARALVTGAGSGIGACYARHLAELGYNLVLTARDRHRLDAVADTIRRETGVDCEVLPRDLSTAAGIDDLVERLGRDASIEIIVNSAGGGSWGRLVELADEQLRAEVELNVTAVHRLTIAAARAMRSRGRGAIVNVASLAAFGAQPYTSTYSGTKAFVENFSEALHEELRADGVIVQALCPGFTRTNIFVASGADPSQIPSIVWLDADVVVRASLAALRRRRAICVPGLRYKFAWFLMRCAPRWINRRIMAHFLGRFEKLRLRKPDPAPQPAPAPAPSAPRSSETNTETDAPPAAGDAPRTVQNQPLETVR